MPRTRSDTSRADKVDELLDAAESLFEERGFAGTTTALLARTAGVSERTLFWYFPTKDHVLVAVVDRAWGRQSEALTRGPVPRDFADGLFRVLLAMRGIRHLLPTMHQRAEVSEVVEDARARYRDLGHRAIVAGLRPLGVPEAELDASVEIVACFTDGVLLRNLDDDRLRYLCGVLANRFRGRSKA